jgi:hypothetical protein
METFANEKIKDQIFIPLFDHIKAVLSFLPVESIVAVNMFAKYQMIIQSDSIALESPKGDGTWFVHEVENPDITFQDWHEDGKDFTIGEEILFTGSLKDCLNFQMQRAIAIREESDRNMERLKNETKN